MCRDLCARLERDGQLAREGHPDDGRARTLHLTPQGKRLARSVDTQSTDHFDQIVPRLDSVTELITSIEQLTKAMAPTNDDDR